MIIDSIENLGSYTSVVKNLDAALRFIDGNYDLPLGKQTFEGGAVMSVEGVSLHISQKDFEAHRSFADVMIVLDHEETVSYRRVDELAVKKEYDAEVDCAMYSGKEGDDIIVTVPKGYFYVMLPGEGHKPCVHTDAEKPFRKYIVKCKQE